MPELQFDHVNKQYAAGSVALCDVNLQISAGELLTVVGPSGSGKSTLLRLIAGLEAPTSGVIRRNGCDLADRSPAQREIGMVFQSHNLLEHLDVRDNLCFGSRLRRQARAPMETQLAEVVSLLNLEAILDRWPTELSGGEQQRVAIGRALMADAEILLLDEPLAQLDATRQAELRTTLRTLHQSTQVTMIYVTHDQGEAMALGDRIAVLSAGRIQQVAKPRDAYQRPATHFVAEFLGVPSMNRLDASCDGHNLYLGSNTHGLPANVASQLPAAKLCVGVRAEAIKLNSSPTESAAADAGQLVGRVSHVEYLGHDSIVHVQVDQQPRTIACRISLDADVPVGASVHLIYHVNDLHLFMPDGSIAWLETTSRQ